MSDIRDLRSLPKCHLHLHLEAAMRPGTLADLAAQYSLPMPRIGGYETFADFVVVYETAVEVLRSPADWERLADEVVADAAAEGVVYLEPAFWAARYRDRFGPDRDIWHMVIELFAAAAERHGVAVSWLSAVDRVVDDSEAARGVAELAVELMPLGVVSFGLHNDEVGHPPGDFAEPFAIAQEAGLVAAPHAGELDHGVRVREAVEVLGATRIGHGVRAVEVPGLVGALAASGVCLDVCPTSNVILGVVRSFESHPLGGLLDAGVPCSLNADDPLMFDTTILHEYERCRDVLAFSDERLAAIAKTSIDHAAGLTLDRRVRALSSVDDWLAGAR